PRELYLAPRTRFVADFMGHSNLLPLAWVRAAAPELLAGATADLPVDAEACVRPERIGLSASSAGDARVVDLVFLGSVRRLRVAWRGREVLAELAAGVAMPAPGDAVTVHIASADCAWVRS